MYKLWCLLIYGYIPKWEIYKEGVLTKPDLNVTIGRWYDMRCVQTGKIKRTKVYA